MSSNHPAIAVRGLSKSYTIRRNQTKHTTLADAVVNRIKHPFRRAEKEVFWALRDVDFEVAPGEIVGVIGHNGAGKSTLLKILSRITRPTSGEVELRGRVGSLLEVGTGFHQELTGRENIFLSGTILGMKRREIVEQFDAVVDFAGIQQFLDTPVKRYSSGMYVRLAFAVAAYLKTEILIVDEVLAVGDVQFQQKCLGKMNEIAANGRTVLFVSHNMSAVQTLCSRAIMLDNGSISADDETISVIRYYFASAGSGLNFTNDKPRPVGITSATLRTFQENADPYFQLDLCVYSNSERRVAIDVRLADAVGNPVAYGSLGAFSETELIKLLPGTTIIQSRHHIGALAIGNYVISLDLTRPDVDYLERNENCLSFECSAPPRIHGGKRMMQCWNKGCWELFTTNVCVRQMN